ncbi:MAG: sigma-70 family RNA polymerase sigma factor [Bacteroidales bacterium]|nr:sigma-70 family RNA polymerase sigma factor [Bacteroidales bacterium]
MEVGIKLSEKAEKDYDLVIRARDKGDQKAYAALMNTYREPVYYMLLKMTGSTTDAEDLTIEAFGKAFRSIESYTPNFAFSTWLFRIATNNCIDFIRKRRTPTVSMDNLYSDIDGEEVGINIPSETLDPEEMIIDRQKKVAMREIVAKLKPHYRVLIELRYFDENTYEEIAEQLQIPIGTVKAKLFRAREFLVQMVKDCRELQ